MFTFLTASIPIRQLSSADPVGGIAREAGIGRGTFAGRALRRSLATRSHEARDDEDWRSVTTLCICRLDSQRSVPRLTLAPAVSVPVRPTSLCLGVFDEVGDCLAGAGAELEQGAELGAGDAGVAD